VFGFFFEAVVVAQLSCIAEFVDEPPISMMDDKVAYI
jgi:hypothetical protein